jgi:hypothetical protein
VGLCLSGTDEYSREGRSEEASDVLVVNSGLTDPAVPLDLSLTVRLFAKEQVLEITAKVQKHPAFPTQLFFDKDVKAEIRLPLGLQRQAGSLSWTGDLQGDAVGEFQATVTAVRDMEGTVEASAIGYALGGRVDADTERCYVRVRGQEMQVSRDPFSPADQPGPGTAAPAR